MHTHNTPKYDTVYYWTGGRAEGYWTECNPSFPFGLSAIDDSVAKIRRAGYVAHRGLRSIGAPEGPPSDAEFKALGL